MAERYSERLGRIAKAFRHAFISQSRTNGKTQFVEDVNWLIKQASLTQEYAAEISRIHMFEKKYHDMRKTAIELEEVNEILRKALLEIKEINDHEEDVNISRYLIDDYITEALGRKSDE